MGYTVWGQGCRGALQAVTVKGSSLNRNVKIMKLNGTGHKGPRGQGDVNWSLSGSEILRLLCREHMLNLYGLHFYSSKYRG